MLHYVGGPLLGVEPMAWPKSEHFHLAAGELLLLCSDGLVEQLNDRRERFEGQLAEFRLMDGESAEGALGRLLTRFEAFRDREPLGDDVTVIAIRAR